MALNGERMVNLFVWVVINTLQWEYLVAMIHFKLFNVPETVRTVLRVFSRSHEILARTMSMNLIIIQIQSDEESE